MGSTLPTAGANPLTFGENLAVINLMTGAITLGIVFGIFLAMITSLSAYRTCQRGQERLQADVDTQAGDVGADDTSERPLRQLPENSIMLHVYRPSKAIYDNLI